MQRNWIGRSTGADVDFKIEGREEPITIYTTRPDTLYGATFFVVAADSDLAAELVEDASAEVKEHFENYLAEVKHTTEIDRLSTEREKTGLFIERYAINPVHGNRLPLWLSDYVLADYGHGAIMAVPAHDQRDLEFALAFNLPVRVVLDVRDEAGDAVPHAATSGQAADGDGALINSGPLNGLLKADAIAAITEHVSRDGVGKAAVNYRLRSEERRVGKECRARGAWEAATKEREHAGSGSRGVAGW